MVAVERRKERPQEKNMSGLEDLTTMEEGSTHTQSCVSGYPGLACGGGSTKTFFIDNLLR